MNVSGWFVLPAVPVLMILSRTVVSADPDCYGVFVCLSAIRSNSFREARAIVARYLRSWRKRKSAAGNRKEVPQDVLLEAGEKTVNDMDTARPDWWKEAADLEKQLKEALKTEDYEMAAVCRDKIRALKAERTVRYMSKWYEAISEEPSNIIYSRIRLARNWNEYVFPSRLDEAGSGTGRWPAGRFKGYRRKDRNASFLPAFRDYGTGRKEGFAGTPDLKPLRSGKDLCPGPVSVRR